LKKCPTVDSCKISNCRSPANLEINTQFLNIFEYLRSLSRDLLVHFLVRAVSSFIVSLSYLKFSRTDEIFEKINKNLVVAAEN